MFDDYLETVEEMVDRYTMLLGITEPKKVAKLRLFAATLLQAGVARYDSLGDTNRDSFRQAIETFFMDAQMKTL